MKSRANKGKSATVSMPKGKVHDDGKLNIMFDIVKGEILNGRYKVGKFLD